MSSFIGLGWPRSNNRKAVVLWNRQGYQATITAQWSNIGLALSTVVTARDIWAVSFAFFRSHTGHYNQV